jgi:cell division protein FtsI (penicillin-binding protein 3)
VTIQDPKGGYYGGSLGGPVFKKVMTFVLQAEHVAPTGTKILPIALTQTELRQKERRTEAATTQASLKSR